MDVPYVNPAEVHTKEQKELHYSYISTKANDPFHKNYKKYPLANLKNSVSVILQAKGGLGKTTLASAITQGITGAGCPVTIIEADTDPPDFAEAHSRYPYVSKIEATKGYDIEEAYELMTSTDMPIVMNTGAHSTGDERIFIPILNDVLPAAGKNVMVFIPVDIDEVSHENAFRLAGLMGDKAIVVRNLFGGKRVKDFRLFMSEFWRDREKRGLIINLPEMAEPLRRVFRTGEPRMSLTEIEVHGEMMHRVFARDFRDEFDVMAILTR